MPRPTKYKQATATAICARLAGGESLRSICSDPKLPSKSTVLLWLTDGKHPEFSDQYARAREAAGYAHADNLIDTAERVRDGELDPQQARAMIDAYKWAAERMAPKTHGPKQQIDHSSSDGTMTPPRTLAEFYGEVSSVREG